MSLLKYVFAKGSSLVNEYSVTTAAISQAAMDRISRMKPRIIASSAEISITAMRIISSKVTGMGDYRMLSVESAKLSYQPWPASNGRQAFARICPQPIRKPALMRGAAALYPDEAAASSGFSGALVSPPAQEQQPKQTGTVFMPRWPFPFVALADVGLGGFSPWRRYPRQRW